MCFNKLLAFLWVQTMRLSWKNCSYYERNYVNELKKTNVDDARLFCNVFRFIDDLCAINDGGLFDKHHKSIYPPEMELKKQNIGFNEASFLFPFRRDNSLQNCLIKGMHFLSQSLGCLICPVISLPLFSMLPFLQNCSELPFVQREVLDLFPVPRH